MAPHPIAPRSPRGPGAPAGHQPVVVWDRFVRLFHWGLVACVLLNYFVIDDGEQWHQWLGYTASALVLARVLWGFVGSRYARFADFFPTPGKLRRHLAALRQGQVPSHVGHNPLGALMVLALMACVLALGTTGYLQTTDAFWGEEWLQDVHEALASVLIGLAGLHAAAALLMGRLEHTDLVAAMFTGVKRMPVAAPPDADPAADRQHRPPA